MTTPASERHPSTAGRVLVVVAIIGLALNLRPAAVSVGPLLDEIGTGLGMGGLETGVLTSLPVVAFAVFGALAPRLADRLGPHRTIVLSLTAVVVGLATRTRVEHAPTFLLLSLVALAGMATANVVLPSLVKRHFPDRVGLVTATYSTALAVGITATSVLTVPVAEAAAAGATASRCGPVWRWWACCPGCPCWVGTVATPHAGPRHLPASASAA